MALHAISAKPAQQADNDGQTLATPMLPAWPLTFGLSGFALWWLTGLGDLIWLLSAAVMVHYLLARGRSHIQVPRGFGIWLIFLIAMFASIMMIDSGGRMIGFIQRALMYLSITIIFVYCYQRHHNLGMIELARAFTFFWMLVVLGGAAGLIWPELEIRTPLAWVLPSSLLNNELISEMAYRRLTQFNPDSWAQLWPRPSAPFLYSNGWGLTYALLTPVVLAYFPHARRIMRFILAVMLPLSLIPAGLSQNRGMFIGLAIAVTIIMIWALSHRRYRIALSLLAVLTLAISILVALPVLDRLLSRLETSSTTTDRFLIYREAIERTSQSPIVGYGAPRPSLIDGLPSTGTQGQVWMVTFSHGFIAIAAFIFVMAGLAVLCVKYAWSTANFLSITLAVAVVNAAIGMFYYSLLNTTFVIVAASAAILLKEKNGAPQRSHTGS